MTNTLVDVTNLGKTAVIYLRVSTKEQAAKGGQAEGFSIPAQREALRRKAESLGAAIIEEFIDAGESAKSADRPNLQRMLKYMEANRVDYVLVHKVDRLARNRVDDVAITMAIKKAARPSCRPPRTLTKPQAACCCTASCPRSLSSTHTTSPPK